MCYRGWHGFASEAPSPMARSDQEPIVVNLDLQAVEDPVIIG